MTNIEIFDLNAPTFTNTRFHLIFDFKISKMEYWCKSNKLLCDIYTIKTGKFNAIVLIKALLRKLSIMETKSAVINKTLIPNITASFLCLHCTFSSKMPLYTQWSIEFLSWAEGREGGGVTFNDGF